jgi:laminin, gamma 1
LDCPKCYNLVQQAADEHRSKIKNFDHILTEISENPTVIEDDEFEAKLKTLNEKVLIVVEDAKAGAGSSSGKSLTQKMEDLREQLFDIESSLKEVVGTHDDSKFNLGRANANLENAQEIIKRSQEELNVS